MQYIDKINYVLETIEQGIVALPIATKEKACFEKGWTSWTTQNSHEYFSTLRNKVLQGKPYKEMQFGRLMNENHFCIDFDLENELAQQFWETNAHLFNDYYQERTPNGIHIEFYSDTPVQSIGAKNTVKGKQIGLEILAKGRLIVTYPSDFGKGKHYTYIDPTDADRLTKKIQTISPEVLKLVTDFIAAHAKGGLNLKTDTDTDTDTDKEDAVTQPPNVTSKHPSLEKVKKALKAVIPDEREVWLQGGMALHHFTVVEKQLTAEKGFKLFHNWSKLADTYKDEKDCRTRWNSFKPNEKQNTITINTLFQLAKDSGLSAQDLIEPLQPQDFMHLLDSVEPALVVTDVSSDAIKEAKKTLIPKLLNQREFLSISDVLDDSFFLNFPGLAGKMTREIYARNTNSSAAFSFISAMAILSSIKAGSVELKFMNKVSSATFYAFCLADSGYGKAYYKDVVTNVLSRLHLTKKYETKVVSGQAVHKALQENGGNTRPHLTLVLDEAHEFLSLSWQGSSQSYEKTTRPTLLELYSAHTNPSFGKGTKATKEKEADKRKPLEYPTISLTGYGTRAGMLDIFTEENLANGFINRCVILMDDRPEPRISISDLEFSGKTVLDPFDFEADLRTLAAQFDLELADPDTDDDTGEDGDDNSDNVTKTAPRKQGEPIQLETSHEAQLLQIDFYNKCKVDVEPRKKVLYSRGLEVANRFMATACDCLEIDEKLAQACIELSDAQLRCTEQQLFRLQEDAAQYEIPEFLELMLDKMRDTERNYVTINDLAAGKKKGSSKRFSDMLIMCERHGVVYKVKSDEVKEQMRKRGESLRGNIGDRYFLAAATKS